MHFMSFRACRVAALALAIFLTSTWGVRRLEKEVQSVAHGAGSKLIAGVPILNYHLAYAGKTLSSKKHMRAEPVPGSKHPESWIVVMSKEATDDQLHQLCAKVPGGCTKEGHHAGIPFITVHGSEEELSEVITAAGGAAKYVEPDIVWEATPEVDEVHEVQAQRTKKGGQILAQDAAQGTKRDLDLWGLDRIGHSGGASTNQGKGVHVYVLDTGIRTTHTEFGDRATPFSDESNSWNPECSKGDVSCARDNQGHGTHCAGTIGGATFGVAPQASLYAVQVLGNDGSGAMSWIFSGLDRVATSGQKPAVASMSLGSAAPSTLAAARDSIDDVVEQGVTVVVAAGNSYRDACTYTPSYMPSAITVGSIQVGDKRSHFSSFGSCVDIWAPGSGILSASHTCDGGTCAVKLSGTSMACPHVSGAAALLLEGDPTMKPAAVVQVLLDKASTNYITNLSPNDVNQLLRVGVSEAAQSPPPIQFPPLDVFDGHYCSNRGGEGPHSAIPGTACLCSGFQQGISCYNNGTLGCEVTQEAKDANLAPGYKIENIAFEFGCATCKCSRGQVVGRCPWHGCILGCLGDNCKNCDRCRGSTWW